MKNKAFFLLYLNLISILHKDLDLFKLMCVDRLKNLMSSNWKTILYTLLIFIMNINDSVDESKRKLNVKKIIIVPYCVLFYNMVMRYPNFSYSRKCITTIQFVKFYWTLRRFILDLWYKFRSFGHGWDVTSKEGISYKRVRLSVFWL